MPRSTALHMTWMVSRATCTAVRASICTPVGPTVSTVAAQKYACSAWLSCAGSFKFNSNTGQRQRVAKRNEVAGFLGRDDAGDAGNAQHIAFFGGAGFDEGQGGGQHFDAAAGDGDAVRGNHSAMGLGLPWGHASNGLQ